jgi:cytochrome c oxidase cbb3-type subunit 1
MEGFMWRAYNEFGFLEYSFVETVEAKHISYIIRSLGGLLFLAGSLIMVYNLVRTALGHESRGVREAEAQAEAGRLQAAE